ncbi:glycosyltransferase family 2 protein [uncultured Deinococcus sp.]|uniref:glycosyltransferase family 2 protein n=1 Tax=uncultured Deinococcus sp. TaxID=158789 RepID=UPI002586D76F|nr:glycosyltransferase family 2 protein [uncultured Deinococcus sp.]
MRRRSRERLYLLGVGAFFVGKAANLLLNAAAFPRLRPRPTPPEAARVSILIPARDEARTLPHTLPGVLAQGAGEVLVLDDHSADDTARLAAGLGARVLRGAPLPPGWVGKSWACEQLAGAARGDLLIFTDADVFWRPGALGAVLRALEDSGADLLTVLPRHTGLTPGARLLTPLVDAAVLGWLPYPLLRTRWPLATVANGQLMAFRRAAYRRAGGHAAVRAELLEDTQLARRLKAAGGRVVPALGQGCVEVTMYRSYRESLGGFGKNALGVHLDSRALLLGLGLWHLLAYTLPWLRPASPGVWALRVAGLSERALVNLVSGRRRVPDLAEGLLGPLTPLLALPAYALALRRTVRWKGREYPAR